MQQNSFICDGNCASCLKAGKSAGRYLVVALAGSLAETLKRSLERTGGCMTFITAETEDIEDIHADIVVFAADTLRLEEELLEATRVMDLGLKMVLVLGRYSEYLATEHSVDCATLGKLLGFPVVPSGDATAVISAIERIHEAKEWEPKRIEGLRSDDEEHARLGFVSGALQETVRHSRDNSGHTLAQKVDALLTNRWLGFPLMILILLLVFEATFALGAHPQRWVESGVDLLAARLSSVMPSGWLSSLIVDGIVQGVGAVLAFLPNIIILFFLLSLLEDSGYMSRAAYIMDSVMHRIGLHGNSFIPMLLGFGCNVPAIMAAKDIQNPRDRTLTMLMIPFMSCSARLPVYMLMVSAFFARGKALVMISIYLTGVALSILFAFVMRRTRYFSKGDEDYVSELPPFHLPHLRQTMGHIWIRTSDYLRKITTVILAASVIIWALEYFPVKDGAPADQEQSCLASIGRWMEPVTAPLGFDWKMNVCILTGLPAKEAIVSTLGIMYNTDGGESLAEAMRSSGVFSPAVAIAFMLFVLLYFPCVATVATLRREVGWRWAAFTVVHSLLLAWVVAFAAFRLFSLIL